MDNIVFAIILFCLILFYSIVFYSILFTYWADSHTGSVNLEYFSSVVSGHSPRKGGQGQC